MRNKVVVFGWFFAVLFVSEAFGITSSRINVPRLWGDPPVIDGKISAGEWEKSALMAPIILSSDGGRLVNPHGRFYLGWMKDQLYFAFITDSMSRMPVSKVNKRDGQVWTDDAFELYLNVRGTVYQLIVNSNGVIFDIKGKDPAWNGPWKIATSPIGSEFAVGYAGGETPKRGFVVEVMLPLAQAGLPLPGDGEVWGLQVALDLQGSNPQAVWNPMSGHNFDVSSLGQMVWGGPVNKLEEVSPRENGTLVKVKGCFNEATGCDIVDVRSGAVAKRLLWTREVSEVISLAGGAKYLWEVKNTDHFRFTFPIEAKLNIPVVAVPFPSRNAFYITYDPGRISIEDRVPVRLELFREGRKLWAGRIDAPKLTEKEVILVDYKKFKPGPVQLVVTEEQKDGRLREKGKISLRIPSYIPPWTTFELPKCPTVPEPWTPVKAGKNFAEVWGRKYSLGGTPFLDQAVSLGQDILSAPVTLAGEVDGKPIEWKMDAWKLESLQPAKAVYRGAATSEGLTLQVQTTVEFDGMIRFDWQLTPTGGTRTVENLVFVVPVKRPVARSFMQWPLQRYTFNDQATWNRSGDLPKSGWACEFTPFFWLGDQDWGIQWFAEHRAGWTPADEKKIIQVKCGADSARLILHLADKKRVIDTPLNFTFGLIASPVKPRPSSCDLAGNRIMMLSAPEQFLAKSSVRAGIHIPRGPADVRSSGCFETDFRVDWNPEKPSEKEKAISLLSYHNTQGNAASLKWTAEKKAICVTHGNPKSGERLVAETPVDLKEGTWHRLAWNFGEQTEIYLDGKRIASGTDSIPTPSFDNWSFYQIGGSGRIGLKGWRISFRPRRGEELHPDAAWKADDNTQHLELLECDPTPMNLTNPQVGAVFSPGYLEGSWSYDATNRRLIAGPDSPERTSAEHMAKIGVRGVLFYDWAKNILGEDGPRDPNTFAECVKLCNKNGIRVLPYTPFGITAGSPEFEDYKWEMSLTGPEVEMSGGGWRERGQIAYGASLVNSGAKRALYQIDQFMRLGCGGVYLDGVTGPDNSSNPLCGYDPVIDPVTKKAVPVTHIYDRREYLKKLYCLVKSYRKDAVIDAHASGGYDLPIMSFVTDATNGEALGVMPNWPAFVAPEVIRSEYHARQYGFNSDALFYINAPVAPEYGMALMGVHGQTPRCMWGMFPWRAEKVWALADRFDTRTAQWMPYYDPETTAFKTKFKTTLASAFVHPSKRALLLVANWSDKPVSELIRVNWKQLGLAPNTPVRIVNWNEPVRLKRGMLDLEIKPRQILYVWLGMKG